MYILYFFAPIIVHLILSLFWFLKIGYTLSLFELLISTLVTPIYLIIVYSKFTKKFKNTFKFELGNMVKSVVFLLMIGITIAGYIIQYFNWGMSTGYLYKPDSESILILKQSAILSIVILIIGWGIVKIKDSLSKH